MALRIQPEEEDHLAQILVGREGADVGFRPRRGCTFPDSGTRSRSSMGLMMRSAGFGAAAEAIWPVAAWTPVEERRIASTPTSHIDRKSRLQRNTRGRAC